jgi:hypothetical protein
MKNEGEGSKFDNTGVSTNEHEENGFDSRLMSDIAMFGQQFAYRVRQFPLPLTCCTATPPFQLKDRQEPCWAAAWELFHEAVCS